MVEKGYFADQATFTWLQAENELLKAGIAELEKKLEFTGQHQTLARGIAGEKIISHMLGGELTVHTAKSDLDLIDGTSIEIKYANISKSSKGYEGGRRWQWGKVFGETNAKVFDYLLLIGDADTAHFESYKDSLSPYVLFAIPYAEVSLLTTAGPRGARNILLLTNPARTKGTAARLFSGFQYTIAELQCKFGSL